MFAYHFKTDITIFQVRANLHEVQYLYTAKPLSISIILEENKFTHVAEDENHGSGQATRLYHFIKYLMAPFSFVHTFSLALEIGCFTFRYTIAGVFEEFISFWAFLVRFSIIHNTLFHRCFFCVSADCTL